MVVSAMKGFWFFLGIKEDLIDRQKPLRFFDILVSFPCLPMWRNWYTRTTQNRVQKGVWVRIPLCLHINLKVYWNRTQSVVFDLDRNNPTGPDQPVFSVQIRSDQRERL